MMKVLVSDNISQKGVEILRNAGLDGGVFRKAYEAKTYLPRLQEGQHQAAEAGVTGVPAFVINNARTISGAQPLEVFRKTLSAVVR